MTILLEIGLVILGIIIGTLIANGMNEEMENNEVLRD